MTEKEMRQVEGAKMIDAKSDLEVLLGTVVRRDKYTSVVYQNVQW